MTGLIIGLVVALTLAALLFGCVALALLTDDAASATGCIEEGMMSLPDPPKEIKE